MTVLASDVVDIVCLLCETGRGRTSVSLGPAEELFGEVDKPDRCSECGREPCENEVALDGWRVESDGVGELYVFCPQCWAREFGEERLD